MESETGGPGTFVPHSGARDFDGFQTFTAATPVLTFVPEDGNLVRSKVSPSKLFDPKDAIDARIKNFTGPPMYFSEDNVVDYMEFLSDSGDPSKYVYCV